MGTQKLTLLFAKVLKRNKTSMPPPSSYFSPISPTDYWLTKPNFEFVNVSQLSRWQLRGGKEWQSTDTPWYSVSLSLSLYSQPECLDVWMSRQASTQLLTKYILLCVNELKVSSSMSGIPYWSPWLCAPGTSLPRSGAPSLPFPSGPPKSLGPGSPQLGV